MFANLIARLVTPVGLSMVISVLLWLVTPAEASKVRIKDIVEFEDKQEVELFGYGLVIGLDGTGDGNNTQFTTQSLVNMMERMGLTVDPTKVKVKNIAAVMVTTKISSQQVVGSYLDVTVSSIGDAKSLQGGTLLLTPLSGPDGLVRATAQGPVSIGGFNVQVDEGNKIVNNYTLVGRVPAGARITRSLEPVKEAQHQMFMTLREPDLTTAQRISDAINIEYGITSYVVDAGTVRLDIPDTLGDLTVRSRFLTDIGQMQVVPDSRARVVINERTGTIVSGEFVTIDPVAIASGNITVNIQSKPVISQPEAFSQGQTVVTSEPTINVSQEQARVVELHGCVKLSEVADALNRIGAAPRDIIAIFQALKQAGALRAELIIL
ncbi:MAG: flagellar basal body P-ring protein FlgI [candidate division Zixibacteria bacterium]|nr:flagellar basal body P-ring protein FlgI [candidate division Zixibacteria bacterium]